MSGEQATAAGAGEPRREFGDVTERAGTPATPGQIGDMQARYLWAATFAANRDVLEVACGTGQGLGLLAQGKGRVTGCDIDPANVAIARATYGDRIRVEEASADRLPVADGSMNVILLFEALYYLPDADAFVAECRRALRSDGVVLVSSNNCELFDFVASPFSHRYYGARELNDLFTRHGFAVRLYGFGTVDALPLRHRLTRPLKTLARAVGLVPKTMRGKALIRRLLFGRLPPMPADLSEVLRPYTAPDPIPTDRADRSHRFLYVEARRSG